MIDVLYDAILRLVFFAAGTGLLPPGDGAAPAPPGGAAPAGGGVPVAAANGAQDGGGFPMFIWVIYGALFVGLYFLFIRPNRKREKQRKEMIEAIRAGDNVVTSGGLFGKVMDIGEDSFIVEFGTNKGLRIPVLKTDVLGVREPKLTPPPRVDP